MPNPNSHLNFNPGLSSEGLLVEFSELPESQLAPEITASIESFWSQLDTRSSQLPEVKENKEAIKIAGKELIENFDIKPAFFDSEYRGFIFTSLSSRLAKLNSRESDDPKEYQEKEFIADSTFLLSRNYTNKFEELRHAIDSENNPFGLSEQGKKAIYDKYTDETYSEALTQAIKNGLLNEVKRHMNIQDGEEKPFKVRVLSIMAPNSSDNYGMNIPFSDVPKGLRGDALVKFLRQESAYMDMVRNWDEGLKKRFQQMQQELGVNCAAPAWVSRVDGETYLCVSLPLAEKILYKNEVTKNSSNYTEDDYKRDMAVLQHEYVHTQGGFIDEKLDIDFGVSFEERRAEYYSGDKAGYYDVKNFFQDLSLIFGQRIQDVFEAADQKGRNPVEVLKQYAQVAGIDTVIELLLAVPKNYAQEQTNTLRRSVHEYIGGYDGLLQKLYEKQVKAGKKAEINQRIRDRADQVARYWSPEAYRDYRRSIGTTFLENELTEAIKRVYQIK